MSTPESPPVQDEAEKAAATKNTSLLQDCFNKGALVEETFVYLKALEHGDIATFQVILDNGGSIDYNLGAMGNALISALRHQHDPLLEYLFAKRVDPSKGRWGHMLPPIGVAVRFNRSIKWTERLLQAGARLGDSGALHIAAIRGDIPRMKLLLEYRADVNEVPSCKILGSVFYNKKGSPVHWAVQGGSTEAVGLLLDRGLDLDVLDEDGISVCDRVKEFYQSKTEDSVD